MHEDVVIIIPARLGARRLQNKPLQLIGDRTMIEHVICNTLKTGCSNIYVATDSKLVAEQASKCGGRYIITNQECASGTDRVYLALQQINSHNIRYVINVQGDMPFIRPEVILTVIENLKKSAYGMITPTSIVSLEVANTDSNVKVVVDANDKALYFSRHAIPHGATQFLYHIGIYGFRKDVLMQFVSLPQTALEQTEQLEQLRALQHNIDIGICYVDDIPISVDTVDDLNKAIEYYNKHFVKTK